MTAAAREALAEAQRAAADESVDASVRELVARRLAALERIGGS